MCSIKKSVLKKFTKFTGKHLCQSLYFNKVADLACNFVKIETPAQGFFCEFCEISKNTFSYRVPPVAVFAACNFIEKEIPAKMFFCEFGKISKNIFWRSTSGWRRLKFICEFWEVSLFQDYVTHMRYSREKYTAPLWRTNWSQCCTKSVRKGRSREAFLWHYG